jgi:hypothetical protein
LPADGTNLHIERPRPPSDRFPYVAKAENTERLARELWPWWWWRRRNGPLALPMAAPELGIDAAEATLQCDHGADDLFSDRDFVAVGIGQARSRTQSGALDPRPAPGTWMSLRRGPASAISFVKHMVMSTSTLPNLDTMPIS